MLDPVSSKCCCYSDQQKQGMETFHLMDLLQERKGEPEGKGNKH